MFQPLTTFLVLMSDGEGPLSMLSPNLPKTQISGGVVGENGGRMCFQFLIQIPNLPKMQIPHFQGVGREAVNM